MPKFVHGVIPPRMTTVERNAIPGASLQRGMIVFDTTLNAPMINTAADGASGAWIVLGGGGVGLLSARPLATVVAPGTSYFATDQVVDYISDGTIWHRKSSPAGFGGSWFKLDALAPPGWVKYDGSNLPASTGIYADLYAHLGSTLLLPDTRGRVIAGQGTHAEMDNILDNEGLAVVANRSMSHVHIAERTTGNGASAPVGAMGGDTPFRTSGNAALQDKPAFIIGVKIHKL